MPTKVLTINPRTHRNNILSGVDDQRVAARLFFRENGRRLGQYLIADQKMTHVDVTAETEITVLEVDDWYGNREALDRGIEKQKISQANAR